MGPPIAVGIDLGSSYSKVSILREDGVVEVIPCGSCDSNPTTWNLFLATDEATTGQSLVNPTNRTFVPFLSGMIHLVGSNFADKIVQLASAQGPFKAVNVNGKPEFHISYNNKRKTETQSFSPEELLALLIGKLKRSAEAYLEERITDAVITVPSAFTSFQRWLVVDAAKAVHLNVRRVMNASTAAGFAFGFEYQEKSERNILAFDIGAGTTNVSILTVGDGIFEVQASTGNISLGGEDFTRALLDFFFDECLQVYKKDLRSGSGLGHSSLMRLRNACELAKIELTTSESTTIEFSGFVDGKGRSPSKTRFSIFVNFRIPVTREQFEKINMSNFCATLDLVQQALKDANMIKTDIDEVVLVGGSTRIPKIRTMTKEFFDGKKLNTSLKPEEAVVLGAGLQASIICGVGPRELLDNILLIDTLPYDLGFESSGGIMNPILKRNALLPTFNTQVVNNIQGIGNSIRVFEGQSSKTDENTFLGELRGIPCSSRPSSGVSITFEVSYDNRLTVKVSDSGLENQIDIPNLQSNQLSQEKIKRIKAIRSCVYKI